MRCPAPYVTESAVASLGAISVSAVAAATVAAVLSVPAHRNMIHEPAAAPFAGSVTATAPSLVRMIVLP